MSIYELLQSLSEFLFVFYAAIGDKVFEFFVQYSRQILDGMHLLFDNLFSVVLFCTFILTFGYALIGVYLLFIKNKSHECSITGDYPFVTIQIPTYNELAALNCARRCLAFDYPRNKYEIMIGDDSSDLEVSRTIDLFAKEHPGRVRVTRRGLNIGYKPGNLNHMLPLSKGKYLVIFDSDFLPEQDFLKRIIAPLEQDPSLSAVQARWVTKNFSQNLMSVMGGTIPLLTHHLGLPFLNHVHGNGFIAGSAEAIRKSDLLNLGGWKSGALTEDIEYSLRLTSKGKKILYLETLLCECEAPFTFKDLCKQQMRWAYGVISAVKQHFWSIMRSPLLSFTGKLNMIMILSGYLVTLGFFLLTVFGALSIITHRPEPIQWGLFLSKTFINVAATSGFLLTSIVTLIMGKKGHEIPRMFAASLTVGFLVIFVVTLGISKAFFGRPMKWFMLKKQGNMVSQG